MSELATHFIVPLHNKRLNLIPNGLSRDLVLHKWRLQLSCGEIGTWEPALSNYKRDYFENVLHRICLAKILSCYNKMCMHTLIISAIK